MTRGKLLLFAGCWVVALAASFAVDGPLSRWLYEHEFHSQTAGIMRSTWWARVMKSMGDLRYATLLLVILVVLRKLDWRQALLTFICASMSIISEPGKFILGRSRPVVDGALQGTFQFAPFTVPEGGGAMPSGHALLSFATAMCLTWYHPRWGVAAFVVATIVASERVLEASHFLSDVVLGAGLAILISLWCLNWYDRRVTEQARTRKEQEEIPA